MRNLFFYRFPLGVLGIVEEEGSLTGVFFGREPPASLRTAGFETAETPVIKKAAVQLEEYFAGKRRNFDLPLAPRGTAFQLLIWKALRGIPYGTTLSYGELAARAGRPRACRAAGMANNRNPIVIIIPCHRVIGKNGDLTGYGGGLPVKEYLLALEAGRAGN
ncbi:MAG: methylated-DNA--[protein]-cysteine S-methyltransferase [Treponema sp.]|jgi:methylated-DNA-[protein]-cysteine S-methyltransferase|nr:methylated-DNA--[protein]-cysteine S-methyltransferase [Treponema sp.]